MTVIREDFREILRLVRPGARVLDVGCEDGELLELLTREKRVDGQGLEISPEGVAACLAKGLAVVQGDGDRDLDHFPTRSFDYAILSKTLQQMREPRHVLSELLRIADQAIVSVPNFGHWRMRLSLMTRGRMPETRALPDPWWSTPNIHLCTLRDFTDLCEDLDLRIDACAALTNGKPARAIDPVKGLENWRSESALFLLSRRAEDRPDAVPTDLFGEVALPKAEAPARPKRRGKSKAAEQPDLL
ncbi:methionine biosynthesis protein MetW [Phenylobacterium sp. J367]|uniref:methionine biosynthesis protein MetW n=1 Tax=Phenylobacterium sp. J367 TaxID=2898435 RepID=UPI002151404F|nr:methionine biosynthesis protein MetW [Phenylobacterium sp. J367]MCR5877558.1 methionine biosynthesis protein MetW [Phenylobacterium sp. J367]